MGEAFITRRGGGIPYAVIGVTYPSGSVCTCKSGTLTLTAKDTSGKVLFVIPYAGTWTVKAVKGSQSKSTAVKITTEGQGLGKQICGQDRLQPQCSNDFGVRHRRHL